MTRDPPTLADGSHRAAMTKAWPSDFTNRCPRHSTYRGTGPLTRARPGGEDVEESQSERAESRAATVETKVRVRALIGRFRRSSHAAALPLSRAEAVETAGKVGSDPGSFPGPGAVAMRLLCHL